MPSRMTGTGLDRLVEIIETDAGLRKKLPASDIAEGARAAGELNAIIVNGIKALGLVNDGSIDASDIRALGDWVQADDKREQAFTYLYGTSKNGVETGFQLVEQDSGSTFIFGENAINEVADAIYSVGFGYTIDGRLFDVNGDPYRSVALTAKWLETFLTDEDIDALNNPDVDNKGTTGTGLDELVKIVNTDPGLIRNISRQDIADGAKAADELNHMYLDGIKLLGLANDGSIDPSDIIAIGDWIQEDAGRYAKFRELYGNNEGGIDTGFHLVLDKGAETAHGHGVYDGNKPHPGHLVNHAMKGIYQIGFGSENGHLLDEDGNAKISLRVPASWFDKLLADADMAALSNPDVDVDIQGTTGTGLDRLVEIINGDAGVMRAVSRMEIAEAARAADAMNNLLVDGIKALGLAKDGRISAGDVSALDGWIRADESRHADFVSWHGDDEDGVGTGFHLVEGNHPSTILFGSNAINIVADTIYHIGNGTNRGALIDEGGRRDVSIAKAADWIDSLMSDDDLRTLASPDADTHIEVA